jgi:hypothetical protein
VALLDDPASRARGERRWGTSGSPSLDDLAGAMRAASSLHPKAAAVRYAAAVPVLPCSPRSKAPMVRRGFHAASPDATAVEEWWRREPDALIGIPTGPASGILVLDQDVKEHDGIAALFILCAERPIAPFAMVRTPSGGRHLYFPHPGGRDIRCSVSRLAPGVDVRAAGGYIIAPTPGSGYRLISTAPAEPMPGWLVDLLDPPPPPPRALPHNPRPPSPDAVWRKIEGIMHAVVSVGPGQRNAVLHWAACRFGEMVWQNQIGTAEAVGLLMQAAAAIRLVAEDGERTVERSIVSGMRRGMGGASHGC